MEGRDPRWRMLLKDRTDSFFDAMIGDRHLQETEAYLQRGRTFETMEIDELTRRWLDAFEQAFVLEDWSRAEEANDLEAEIRLRGAVPPALPDQLMARVQ